MAGPTASIWSRPLTIDWARILDWLWRERWSVVLFLGVTLRVLVYLQGRTYWMDEGSLLSNLTDHAILDFSRPFRGDQLAPFGFIVVERVLVRLLGQSVYATRLLPLLCGTVALFLFARLSRLILGYRGALVALTLFALSDDLIYYASELKPYSLDLLAGVAISLATLRCLPGPMTPSHLAVVAVLATLAPWFSFSSVFVVSGCGVTLLLENLAAGRHKETVALVLIGVVWSASFVASYVAARGMLVQATTMYVFWDFAFIPVLNAPLDLMTWNRSAGILLETLTNPLHLIFPQGAMPVTVFVVGMFLFGNLALYRSSWKIWLALVLPILLAVVASVLRRYPFHGRLILELVPACFILLAAVTERVAELDRGRRQIAYKIVLAALLIYPACSAILDSSRSRDRYFNAHGDLHENLFVE